MTLDGCCDVISCYNMLYDVTLCYNMMGNVIYDVI